MVLLRELFFFLHWQFRKNILGAGWTPPIRPPPSPWGLPPPAGYSVWQRSNPARGIQQTCKLLNLLKTIPAITCTFLFSQLLQEQRRRQPQRKRRQIPNNIWPTQAATRPWRTSAEYNRLHTCSAPDPTLKTPSASQLFTLKFRNPPCLPLAPPPKPPGAQLAPHQILLQLDEQPIGFWLHLLCERKTTAENSIVSTVNPFQLDWHLY